MRLLRIFISWFVTLSIGWYLYIFLLIKLISPDYETWLPAAILSVLVWAIWFSFGDLLLRYYIFNSVTQKPWGHLISSGIVGLIVPTALIYMLNHDWWWPQYQLTGVLLTACCGLITGLLLGGIFWTLKYLKVPNKSLNQIGANNAPPG